MTGATLCLRRFEDYELTRHLLNPIIIRCTNGPADSSSPRNLTLLDTTQSSSAQLAFIAHRRDDAVALVHCCLTAVIFLRLRELSCLQPPAVQHLGGKEAYTTDVALWSVGVLTCSVRLCRCTGQSCFTCYTAQLYFVQYQVSCRQTFALFGLDSNFATLQTVPMVCV